MSCGCPSGYTYNNSSGLCEKSVVVPAAISSTAVAPSAVCPEPSNMFRGTVYYDAVTEAQYPLTGQSSVDPVFTDGLGATIIPSAAALSGEFWISLSQNTRGRMNIAGQALSPVINNWEGYSRCVTVLDGEQLSVALSATYGFRLIVDGVLAVIFTPQSPIRASYYLHVFPLVLSAGVHNLTFEAISYGSIPCSGANYFGSFVCEVFKNITPNLLNSINNQDELNLYYAHHSVNGIGEILTTLLLRNGTLDTGLYGKYSCTTGIMNGCVEGGMTCEYTETTPRIPCCFTLTNCETAHEIVTNTDLTQYAANTVRIAEAEGCFLITVNEEEDCSGAIAVTVEHSYVGCTACQQVYYKLVDCLGQATSIYTTQNLSAYVGKVVKLTGYSVCWTVTTTHIVPPSLRTISVSQSYNTCNACSG